MTMEGFTKFLLQSGVISEGQLAEAAVACTSATPSVASIVNRFDVIDKERQLSILIRMAQTSRSYIECGRSLGSLSESEIDKIEELRIKKSKNVFHMLVEQKVCDLEVLIKNIDEFIAELSDSDELLSAVKDHRKSRLKTYTPAPVEEAKFDEVQKVTPVVDPPQEPVSQRTLSKEEVSVSQSVESAEPAGGSQTASAEETNVGAFEFNEFDRNILKEYLDLLTKEIKVEVVGILNGLSDKSNTDANLDFDRLVQLISPIEGGARFLGAKLTETLVRSLNQMNMKLARTADISKEVIERSIGINRKVLEEVYILKVFMEVSASEAKYWESVDKQASFATLVKDLKEAA